MITFYHRTVKEPQLKILEDFTVGSWVHAHKPDSNELDLLSKKLNVERNILEDAMDPFEVPRVERDGETVYVFTRVPYGFESGGSTTPMMIAVGENFLLTIIQRRLPFIDKFLSGKTELFTTQKVKFFLQIFLEITHTYNSFLTGINRKVRSMSINLERISNEDIKQFVIFESTLNDFLDALVPMGTMLKNIVSGRFFRLYEEDKELVDDLMLANNELTEVGKASLKTIVNIRNAYSTIMTNNLNRVIKLLTALTIVLTIPTMISSFYGMNILLPLSSSPNAFWIILFGTILVSITALAIFIRNRWI